ncbi:MULTISPECIES: hypothetical protein [unclassified Nocardioides]|uniref:hypothetical protein n=1 Tax=unclassified Nocardioides TaxID=2615069 RepID=UPI000702F339|nr:MULTISPECIES: hypothetical protein [unclassified Nocardioides]KRC46217.1 hypothetical protein ASE19_20395 [Nocardioides sp. Root79]KRC69564.1 hypothetical protein ASE20_13255 [Nocardioides sp. Root240]
MGWWAWVLIAVAAVLIIGFVYDRRRAGAARVRGDSASRQRDFGRSVEHDNSGLQRKIGGGPGPL